MKIMSGKRYVKLSDIYHKLGTMYHEIGNGINALRFYQAASTKCCFDRLIECMISKSTTLVLGAMEHSSSFTPGPFIINTKVHKDRGIKTACNVTKTFL